MLSIYLVLNGPWDKDLYLNANIMDCHHNFFGEKRDLKLNEWIFTII